MKRVDAKQKAALIELLQAVGMQHLPQGLLREVVQSIGTMLEETENKKRNIVKEN